MRNIDIYDQMKDDSFVPEDRSHLWLPVDDMLLSFFEKLTDGGSLAGAQPLAAVHPDYATELFGQRIGIQVGAKHTAYNPLDKPGMVEVPADGVFRIDADLTKNDMDHELPQVHERSIDLKGLTPPNDTQLVVRVIFHKDAKDVDGYVRFSTGSVRLVANGTNYFPVGTMEGGRLMTNKVDDFLMINIGPEDRGADFVFFVNSADAIAGGKGADKNAQKIADGVFIEVKRLAKVDLGGRPVDTTYTQAKNIKVERKPTVMSAKPEPAPAAPAPAPAAAENKNPMQTIRQGTAERNAQINK
jgi:hypothetical protein